METDASKTEPLLAIYLHFDFALAAELMLQIDRQARRSSVAICLIS
jgi:hypothetical protein